MDSGKRSDNLLLVTSNSFEAALDNLRLDDKTKQSLVDKHDELIEEAREIAECDHENISITPSPKVMESSMGHILTDGDSAKIEEGTVTVFRANCIDCGKEMSAALNIELDR